jgi:uncharacterized protein YheU (UPF0270 family)
MEIPHTQLSQEALRAIIEDFVTRDGTDYGTSEAPLEQKVAQVLRALDRGEAMITFDPATSSCGISPRDRSRR